MLHVCRIIAGRTAGAVDMCTSAWITPHPPKSAPTLAGFAVLAVVFLFLMLVVAGALTPSSGPLIKHEPVSSARVR